MILYNNQKDVVTSVGIPSLDFDSDIALLILIIFFLLTH